MIFSPYPASRAAMATSWEARTRVPGPAVSSAFYQNPAEE
jgi:hypothetical protein